MFVSLTQIGPIFSPFKNQPANQFMHPHVSFGMNIKISTNTGDEALAPITVSHFFLKISKSIY